MSDRIFGVVLLALALFYAWGTSLTKDTFLPQALSPRALPYILSMLAGVCAIYMIARPDPEPKWPAKRGWLEIAAAVLVMFVYAHILPELGFVISTFAASAYFVWRFQAKLIESVFAGLAISLGIYSVFHLVLGLSLAKGPFGF